MKLVSLKLEIFCHVTESVFFFFFCFTMRQCHIMTFCIVFFGTVAFGITFTIHFSPTKIQNSNSKVSICN